jgi:hypothetical protein
MDTKAENITANGREWIRLRKAYGATGSEDKNNRRGTQINADKVSRSVCLRKPLLVKGDLSMAAPNEITGVQKSITGRATMKSDRGPHYLRKSAFICGSVFSVFFVSLW